MIAYPITPQDITKQREEALKPVEYKVSDFLSGFKEENLPYIAYDYMVNNQDFKPQDGYNPKEDEQAQSYMDFYDQFMFSKSPAETTAILTKKK